MLNYSVNFFETKGGEKIAYRSIVVERNKKNIILIHGNMSSSVYWIKVMEKIANNYNVYAMDLRGFGDSSYNEKFDSLTELAKDVIEFIENKRLKEIVLVGWSLGGGVALEVANVLGNKIDKLILLSSIGINGYPMFKKNLDGRLDLSTQLLSKEEIAKDPIQSIPAIKAFKEHEKEYFKLFFDKLIYNINKPEEEEYNIYLAETMKQRNLIDIFHALVHFNISDKDTYAEKANEGSKNITMPIIIFHGEKDLIVPIAEAKRTKAFFKNQADLFVFKNSGHSILIDEFNLLMDKLNSELK